VDETRLADVVATAYGAASGGNTWFDFGVSLCRLVGAQRSSLRLVDGTLTNLLGPRDEADAAYLAHYHRVDPYRRHAAATATPPPANTARLGSSIIPIPELHHTEYFTDYAARYGLHYMLGGRIDLQMPLPIGLHRDAAAGAFTDVERQVLERILPHLQRALQLRARLASETRTSSIGTAALNALSACVVVVDGTMQVLHVNEAGASLTSPGRSGLTVGRAAVGGMQLSAWHRDDNDALRRLVASAASGDAGGAMRVRARSEDVPEEATLAVLVSPIPAHLVTTAAGLARGLAMIVARELSKPEPVPEWLLTDLYGLTSAEAAVAAALAGGIRAEDVARKRRVSLDTVRTQARTVLRKTNAANLRDFERIVALVSAA
jgi:DNA-binding CsgD family transcriptional regulator